MDPFVKNNIAEVSQDWLMTPAERCAMIGLLSRLRPDRTLEIGFRFGGCTNYLAEFSKRVITVDLDHAVIEANGRWGNVLGVCMNSVDFLRKSTERFDFAVIDGDHTRQGAALDLSLAIPLCDTIVLHDTMNPKCRQGYLDALQGFEGFYDLDFVLNSGIWGGLGIVCTKL